MRKILYVSGIIAVFLLVFLLTGPAAKDDAVKNALRQGNQKYISLRYKDALKLYETGLEASPENKTLNFNAAQAAYLAGDYQKAAEYYNKGEDCVEKFLNAGNIFFRAGDAVEDEEQTEQKAQFYIQAMKIYYEGILKYPQDVSLKYNFEKVKAIVEELLKNMEQQGEGEEGEESESQESQAQEQEGSEEDSESQEAQEGQESEENQDDGEDQESYSQEEGEDSTDLDQEAIERILQMLENQEEESLKNNQEIINGGKNENGW